MDTDDVQFHHQRPLGSSSATTSPPNASAATVPPTSTSRRGAKRKNSNSSCHPSETLQDLSSTGYQASLPSVDSSIEVQCPADRPPSDTAGPSSYRTSTPQGPLEPGQSPRAPTSHQDVSSSHHAVSPSVHHSRHASYNGLTDTGSRAASELCRVARTDSQVAESSTAACGDRCCSSRRTLHDPTTQRAVLTSAFTFPPHARGDPPQSSAHAKSDAQPTLHLRLPSGSQAHTQGVWTPSPPPSHQSIYLRRKSRQLSTKVKNSGARRSNEHDDSVSHPASLLIHHHHRPDLEHEAAGHAGPRRASLGLVYELTATNPSSSTSGSEFHLQADPLPKRRKYQHIRGVVATSSPVGPPRRRNALQPQDAPLLINPFAASSRTATAESQPTKGSVAAELSAGPSRGRATAVRALSPLNEPPTRLTKTYDSATSMYAPPSRVSLPEHSVAVSSARHLNAPATTVQSAARTGNGGDASVDSSRRSSRTVLTRPRRAQSVPNMRARAMLDLDRAVAHRLLLPPHLVAYLDSLPHRRNAQQQSANSVTGRSVMHSNQTSDQHAACQNRPSTAYARPPTVIGAAPLPAAATSSRAIFHPSLHPPISRQTLHELDLCEILLNPQLRHDVVFDPNVQFRPNFDGERGRRKREAGERYWIAVKREVECGCTCTAFEGRVMLPCTCGGMDKKGKSGAYTSSTTSRIPVLVQELRAICLSILPSTLAADAATSSASQAPQIDEAAAALANRAASRLHPGVASDVAVAGSPSSHHALIASTLDPALIAQELAHGVLDVPALVSFMAAVLKLHCAPMRDETIERMVHVVCELGDVAKGLRMCFEILELMKLDIANHQLRSTRPYLVETAIDFEACWFRDQLDAGKLTLDRTRTWFRTNLDSAVARLALVAPGSAETMATSRKTELVSRAFSEGFMQLVFSPTAMAPSQRTAAASVPSTPSTPSHPSPSSSSLNHTYASCYPETFQFDAYRLVTFHNDVTDLTVVYMLLLLFRQLAASPLSADENKRLRANGNAAGATAPLTPAAVAANAAALTQSQLESVKAEVWCLLNDMSLTSAASAPTPASSDGSAPSSQTPVPTPTSAPAAMLAGGIAKLEDPRWRASMRDVLLQISARARSIQRAAHTAGAGAEAGGAGMRRLPSLSATTEPPPSEETLRLLQSWLDTNLRSGSALFKLCQGKLRDVVRAMLDERVSGHAPLQQQPTAVANAARARPKVVRKHEDDEGRDEKVEGGAAKKRLRISTTGKAISSAPLEAALKKSRTPTSPALWTPPPATPASAGLTIVRACGPSLSTPSLASPLPRTPTTPLVPRTPATPVAAVAAAAGSPATAMPPTGTAGPFTPTTATSTATDWTTHLQRAGLTPFAPEVRLLRDRLAKVAFFHLGVFADVYAELLP